MTVENGERLVQCIVEKFATNEGLEDCVSREAKKAPAIFLDRDGTPIRDVGHLYRQDQVELLPRVAEAIRLCAGRGFSWWW